MDEKKPSYINEFRKTLIEKVIEFESGRKITEDEALFILEDRNLKQVMVEEGFRSVDIFDVNSGKLLEKVAQTFNKSDPMASFYFRALASEIYRNVLANFFQIKDVSATKKNLIDLLLNESFASSRISHAAWKLNYFAPSMIGSIRSARACHIIYHNALNNSIYLFGKTFDELRQDIYFTSLRAMISCYNFVRRYVEDGDLGDIIEVREGKTFVKEVKPHFDEVKSDCLRMLKETPVETQFKKRLVDYYWPYQQSLRRAGLIIPFGNKRKTSKQQFS